MSGRAVLVTGGHSHPPELSQASLTAVLAAAGLQVDVSPDVEEAFRTLADGGPDLLVVNALRFTMGHPRYDEYRQEWAFSLSAPAREAVEGWVTAGGALLALHTALVSFDDWAGWGDLLGGSWDWDRSGHGPIGPVDVRVGASSSLGAGPASFTLTDECYVDLDVRDDVEMVATMSEDAGPVQPACWVRSHGAGRVATSALGHDLRSLDDPSHRALLAGLLAWLVPDLTEDDLP